MWGATHRLAVICTGALNFSGAVAREQVDRTAAVAPERRSTSIPSHQALAFSGSGRPPHSLRRWITCPSSISRRIVSVAGACGNTLSETSQMTPRQPIEPASARDTS